MTGRILFLIRSLDVGGSERQLVALATALLARGHDVEVAVFYGGGAFEAPLREAGVPVHDLGKRTRWDVPAFGLRLLRLLRARRPAVLHAYLPEANLVSLVARIVLPRTRVVWGVRASYMDLRRYGWLPRVLAAVAARGARFAHVVVYNSEAGYRHHVAAGYPVATGAVVPNGIDTEVFSPRPEARAPVRAGWEVEPEAPLVGIVGRIDPVKGHGLFLRAAQRLAGVRADVRFVVVGDGPAAEVAALRAEAERLGIDGRLVWAGRRADLPEVYAALDVATLASVGEGFPNVVGEAMACGVPCVATDVGDSREIIGDTGACVPPGEADALYHAWATLLALPPAERRALGRRARARIVERYGIDALAERTLRALAVSRS